MRILRSLLLLPLLALCLRAQLQLIPGGSTISSTFQYINDNFQYMDNKGNGSPTSGCTVANVGQRYFRVDAGAQFQSLYYCENIGAGLYGWVGPYGTNSGGPAGSVTSVGLSLPSIFAVTGSPVTTSGNLSATLVSQAANTFFAAPSGVAGVPSFRLLTLTDLPSLSAANLSNGITGSGSVVLAQSPTLLTPNLGTPSALNLANATNLSLSTGVTGTLNHSNITSTAVTPGSYTCANVTVQADGSLTSAANGSCGASNYQLFEANGTPVTQRSKFNLAAGSNVTITASDNGTDTTTFTVASTGGGGGGSTLAVPTATISGATATFFSACTTTPCNVSKGSNQIDQITATNSLTAPGSGSGTVYVYWTSSGCAIGSPSGVTVTGTGSGQCSVASSTQTAYPNNLTAALFDLDYAAGAWTAVRNRQPTAANPPRVLPGNCILQTLAPGTNTLAFDTTCAPVHHAVGATYYLGGSPLTTSTLYVTVPFACTISSWDIAADAGTATVKLWKIATGTAIPTATNSISTSGFSLSTGTAVHSTTLTDLSTTSVSANDIVGFNLSAVSGAAFVNFIMGCDQ